MGWINEIERAFRTSSGFEVAVTRNPRMEFLLGYVDVHDHPAIRDLDKEAVDALEAPGGITFVGEHKYYTDPPRYLIGFDCGHAWDRADFGGSVKDVDFVANELEKLAEQLQEIEIRSKVAE